MDILSWDWQIGRGEAFVIENGMLGKDLLISRTSLTGKEFLSRISETEYYLIFADLKAYTKCETNVRIETYDDF